MLNCKGEERPRDPIVLGSWENQSFIMKFLFPHRYGAIKALFFMVRVQVFHCLNFPLHLFPLLYSLEKTGYFQNQWLASGNFMCCYFMYFLMSFHLFFSCLDILGLIGYQCKIRGSSISFA